MSQVQNAIKQLLCESRETQKDTQGRLLRDCDGFFNKLIWTKRELVITFLVKYTKLSILSIMSNTWHIMLKCI